MSSRINILFNIEYKREKKEKYYHEDVTDAHSYIKRSTNRS